MKKILSLMLIITTIIACKDGIRNNNTENKQVVPIPIPPTPPNPPPSIEKLKENDILTMFNIRRKEITASAAAKKIEKGLSSPSTEITFTKIKIISYDDEAGKFKIHFEGTKKDGSSFDDTISFTQFIHPLKGKEILSLNKFELNFDEAIEHNYSAEIYVEKLNESIKEKTMLKELSFMLNDGITIIQLGKHERYTMLASAEKDITKIRIKPEIVYLKLQENETTETQKTIPELSFTNLRAQLTKDYFTATDVFNYVLSKVDEENVIKENKTVFASSFYVLAKANNPIPDFFTDKFKAYIKHYHDIYEEKDANEHLKLDIGYGIHDPKNGGVDADDYKGSLKINLCIATNKQIINQNGIVATKTIEKCGGFASIPDDAALAKKTHLFFNLIPKNSHLTPEEKKKWKKKELKNYPLLKVNENGISSVNNPFANSFLYLCVNSGESNPNTHLGCTTFGASKTRNGKIIFIENISLTKVANLEFMEIAITLKGYPSKELKTTVSPY